MGESAWGVTGSEIGGEGEDMDQVARLMVTVKETEREAKDAMEELRKDKAIQARQGE